MAESHRIRLPAPFDQVTVSCETYWEHISLEYVGFPDDLIRSGAIDADMVPTGRVGVRRLDSHGDAYRRRRLPNGRLLVNRSISNIDRALTLPGAYVDQESEIGRLLADPKRMIYDHEDGNCWYSWYGTRETLKREGLDVETAAPLGSGSFGPYIVVGLAGFVQLSWCAGYGPDPRKARGSMQVEPTVGELLKLFPGRGFKKRERSVGRFQRPAEWTSIGNVLFIDWRNVRQQATRHTA